MQLTGETRLERYPDLGYRSQEEIDRTQVELLRRHVAYLEECSPFYRTRLKESSL